MDIRPDSVVMIVVQAQRTKSLAEESLHFSGEAASGSQMTTQEIPVAGPPRVLGRSVREPVVQTEEKIVEVQQMQTIERVVKVLEKCHRIKR